MTIEKQQFEDVSPIKHGDFQPVMLVFGGVSQMILMIYTFWRDDAHSEEHRCFFMIPSLRLRV